MADWKYARNLEGITSLGEKPFKEEEGASVESFEVVYVDENNKEDFPF